MLDDGVPTASSAELADVEADVAALYRRFFKYVRQSRGAADATPVPLLDREAHARYLARALGPLPGAPHRLPHTTDAG